MAKKRNLVFFFSQEDIDKVKAELEKRQSDDLEEEPDLEKLDAAIEAI